MKAKAKEITQRAAGDIRKGITVVSDNIVKGASKTNPMAVLNILLLAGGAYVLYNVLSGVNKAMKLLVDPEDVAREQQKIDENTKTDLNKLQSEGIKPSYPDTSYANWANQLESAFLIAWGTNEDAVYRIFGYMKNDADVIKLEEAFGLRRMEWTLAKANLAMMIDYEMSNSEISKINEILKSKGITRRY